MGELTIEKRADIESVRSYRSALGFIVEAMADRPLRSTWVPA
jgi:hypothetical protein